MTFVPRILAAALLFLGLARFEVRASDEQVYAQGVLLQEDSSSYPDSESGELIYVLQGGLEDWKRTVLFPDLSDIDRLAEEDVERIRRVSLFFGGNPGSGGRLKARPEVLYDKEGC